MKLISPRLLVILALSQSVNAQPIKCVVNGKTIYTDDSSNCGKATVKAVDGNLSTFPKVTANHSNSSTFTPSPISNQPTMDNLLQGFGLSSGDVANGWQTIMDAKQRGSWQAPEMPNE